MSRPMKYAALWLASLLVVLAATNADAAYFSASHSSVRVAKPVAAPRRGVVHGSATAVRTTPYRPHVGPSAVHASATAVRR